jgi:hypothetical protein
MKWKLQLLLLTLLLSRPFAVAGEPGDPTFVRHITLHEAVPPKFFLSLTAPAGLPVALSVAVLRGVLFCSVRRDFTVVFAQ